MQDQINALGTNLLVVSPGSTTDSTGLRGGFGSASTLTVQDADRARLRRPPRPTSRPWRRSSTSSVVARATAPPTGRRRSPARRRAGRCVRSRGVTSGRFLTAADEARAPRRSSCSGPTPRRELFSDRNPVGQTVTYNGVTLEVVGVLDGAQLVGADTSNNDLAIVPLSTYAQRLVGGTNRNSVSSIYVKATSAGDALGRLPGGQRAAAQPARHHRRPPNADFSIATQESILVAPPPRSTTR